MNHTPETTAYLLELFQRTKGDLNARVSMYDVGFGLGMEKAAAGKLAEDLIASGWVEIKSLSGGIGITAEGIAAARAAGALPESPAAEPALGKDRLLSASDRPLVEQIISAIKGSVPGLPADYARLEEIFIDIKTLEVQLLSPRPKTAILREGLASIQAGLEACGQKELAARVGRFIAR